LLTKLMHCKSRFELIFIIQTWWQWCLMAILLIYPTL
jgi:hypothetical protein